MGGEVQVFDHRSYSIFVAMDGLEYVIFKSEIVFMVNVNSFSSPFKSEKQMPKTREEKIDIDANLQNPTIYFSVFLKRYDIINRLINLGSKLKPDSFSLFGKRGVIENYIRVFISQDRI